MTEASFIYLLLWHRTEVQYKPKTNQGRSIFHTHRKPPLGGNSASAQQAPLGHTNANQHSIRATPTDTSSVQRDEQVEDTHTGKGQGGEKGGEILMAEDGCMTDICL